MPIGHFLINGLTGKEKANLVLIALERLYETGVRTICITCDGPAAFYHVVYARNESGHKRHKAIFIHSTTKEKIFGLLDTCHMLKLVRNCFASLGRFRDSEGGVIDWKFIKALENIQSTEGFRAGNRLSARHINFQNAKMKVSVAAQLLSSSVATGIEFANKDLGIDELHNSEATVNFIRKIDHLFDFTNSRNPYAYGSKAAVNKKTFASFKASMDETLKYIMGLKDKKNQLLVTRKKTPFIGFSLAIKTVFSEYMKS